MFRIAKYSVSLASVAKKYHELTEEEKCDYVIANYMFIFMMFAILVVFGVLSVVLDKNLYDAFLEKIKESTALPYVFFIILGVVGRFGHFSTRMIKWKSMSREDILADKISMMFQSFSMVGLIYIAMGVF